MDNRNEFWKVTTMFGVGYGSFRSAWYINTPIGIAVPERKTGPFPYKDMLQIIEEYVSPEELLLRLNVVVGQLNAFISHLRRHNIDQQTLERLNTLPSMVSKLVGALIEPDEAAQEFFNEVGEKLLPLVISSI